MRDSGRQVIGVAACFLAAGAGGFLIFHRNASACASVLGQLGQAVSSTLASRCNTDALFMDLSYAALAIGVVLVVVAVAVGAVDERQAPPPGLFRPQFPQPGWYDWAPGDPHFWDGQRWLPPGGAPPGTPPSQWPPAPRQ